MGRGQSSRKTIKKTVEEQLQDIENQDFIEMTAAMKIWPVPTTKPKHLKKLIDQGLLPGQNSGSGKNLENIGFRPSNLVRLSSSSPLSTTACAFLLVLFFMVFCITLA
jgi:hypothetical protein